MNAYQLLELGDVQQMGDEMFNVFEDEWQPLIEEDLADGPASCTILTNDFPTRRPIPYDDAVELLRTAVKVRIDDEWLKKAENLLIRIDNAR